jgi:hypothetical protein
MKSGSSRVSGICPPLYLLWFSLANCGPRPERAMYVFDNSSAGKACDGIVSESLGAIYKCGLNHKHTAVDVQRFAGNVGGRV